jgi:hypothetical protein
MCFSRQRDFSVLLSWTYVHHPNRPRESKSPEIAPSLALKSHECQRPLQIIFFSLEQRAGKKRDISFLSFD